MTKATKRSSRARMAARNRRRRNQEPAMFKDDRGIVVANRIYRRMMGLK